MCIRDRAEEPGKGFAAVADEIRNLAEQSASTVGNIQEVTAVSYTHLADLPCVYHGDPYDPGICIRTYVYPCDGTGTIRRTAHPVSYTHLSGTVGTGTGGGVCQVSSTLYAAMLHAGLPATERLSLIHI